MMLNVLLALLAVIVVAIATSMFLDDRVLSYLVRRETGVPVLNPIDLTSNADQEFFINTQISDDMPYNY